MLSNPVLQARKSKEVSVQYKQTIKNSKLQISSVMAIDPALPTLKLCKHLQNFPPYLKAIQHDRGSTESGLCQLEFNRLFMSIGCWLVGKAVRRESEEIGIEDIIDVAEGNDSSNVDLGQESAHSNSHTDHLKGSELSLINPGWETSCNCWVNWLSVVQLSGPASYLLCTTPHFTKYNNATPMQCQFHIYHSILHPTFSWYSMIAK